jgi:nucleoside-diphosphate-sugar epimerase
MKVLVAGDRGYIGAVLVSVFREAGYQVSGLDLGLYEGCDFGPGPEEIGARPASDIRDADASQLAGYDAVVCLAALSNDPLGDLNPEATYSVNLEGTLALARAAKAVGVERFLFASSCSLYGAAGSAAVAEDADMFPVTPYGQAKVDAERELSLLAGDAFSPTYLRNATAYGASPRLRLDIVVSSCMIRRSTWVARRTTSRSATSPRWSAARCPDRSCRSPMAPGRICATTASTSPS